jgi:ubiquinol-cytochrome c reductase cytochrome c subunit
MRHRVMLTLAMLCGGLSLWTFAAQAQQGEQEKGTAGPTGADAATRGGALFAEGCASCHGVDARGVRGRGPSLRGVGAASVDFYLRTGRMPLSRPGIEPERADPVYTRAQIDDLVAYVTGFDGRGPAIPRVNPAAGELELGRRLYTDSCSGCHQIVAQGGIAPGLVAPPLDAADATEIAEAIRVGPYLMPRFGERQLDAHDVDSIARYVTEVGQHPPNEGGWGIGNVGPIPEGMVAWLLAGTALLLVARVIGERAT